MSNYSKIKQIILRLNSDELLKEKLYIVGGIVPYLVSNTISHREHSDIDIIVEEKNMGVIRQYLKNNNLYEEMYDSEEFDYNAEKLDYGIDCTIDGITVNFAPFIITDKSIIQRNFLSKQSNGINALVIATIQDIKFEDCILELYINKVHLKTYNLEMIKLMKEKSKKTKDKIDIKVIDDFGYDNEKYKKLKLKTDKIKFKVVPKSKILRLFIK